MRLFLLSIVAFLLVSVCGCRKVPHDESFVVEKKNNKYNLTCIFAGENMDLGKGQYAQLISSINIRDDKTGYQTQFQPIDAASLYQSRGYFLDVWSPDEEHLVLPLGRFDGFAIFASKNAVDLLASHGISDSIRVEGTPELRLWHTFGGWRGRSTLLFNAGLSNQSTEYEYAVDTHTLTGTPPKLLGAVGIDKQGKIIPTSP